MPAACTGTFQSLHLCGKTVYRILLRGLQQDFATMQHVVHPVRRFTCHSIIVAYVNLMIAQGLLL